LIKTVRKKGVWGKEKGEKERKRKESDERGEEQRKNQEKNKRG
jgi:hypothetical protein